MLKAFFLTLLLAMPGIALADAEPDFYPANQIPTLELERMDAEAAGRLGETPFYNGGLQLFNEPSCGNRLFVEYARGGFNNVTQVQQWCEGFMGQFNIGNEHFNDHCGWSRSGSYGRYNYSGIFIYAVEYAGAPRFYFERYCDEGYDDDYDDGGGYDGGGGY